MDHPAVLIIDDEPALARNLAAYLRRVGYEVRTAGSAEDGLAALAQFRPAVVVCDHDLPGMSGLDAVRRLRGS
ncbi:MAG TPA: response regulator, partial [Albitalea sp.]